MKKLNKIECPVCGLLFKNNAETVKHMNYVHYSSSFDLKCGN